MESIITSFNWRDLWIYFFNSFRVGSSCGMLTIAIQPFTIFLKKLKNWWYFSSFCVLFMRGIKIFLPFVQKGFELIFTFIGFENDSVFIEHLTFQCEIFLYLLFCVSVELLRFEFDGMMSFLFGFFDFELFFNWNWSCILSGYLLWLFILIFFLFLFDFLFLWYFSFLSPLFD